MNILERRAVLNDEEGTGEPTKVDARLKAYRHRGNNNRARYLCRVTAWREEVLPVANAVSIQVKLKVTVTHPLRDDIAVDLSLGDRGLVLTSEQDDLVRIAIFRAKIFDFDIVGTAGASR